MSTHRIDPRAGWVNPRSLPRGPAGRALCRACGSEVPPRRRTFCSPTCVHAWKLGSDPGYVRSLVLRRDRGICALCGRDCLALERALLQLRRRNHRAWKARRDALGWPRRRRSYWDVDHITPVVEGGGGCDLKGLRTLCLPCHKQATRDLTARRVRTRLGISEQPPLEVALLRGGCASRRMLEL